MPTIRENFIQDIIEHPEDDAPRLIFADWLDENGEPERAELIRVQIRLAELKPGPEEHRKASSMLERYRKGDPVPLRGKTPAVLLLREALLLGNIPMPWLGYPLWAMTDVEHIASFTGRPASTSGAVLATGGRGAATSGNVGDMAFAGVAGARAVFRGTPLFQREFRRGFVDVVSCRCEHWLQHGPALVRQHPLREVRLTDREPAAYPGSNWWYWYGATDPLVSVDHRRIPLPIWQLLEAHEKDGANLGLWCSKEAAVSALSTACLLWARSQPSLPGSS